MLSFWIRVPELTKNLSLVNTTELSVNIQCLLIKCLQKWVHKSANGGVLALFDNLGTSLFGV